jgi:peptidoglycan-associated lipoprotein
MVTKSEETMHRSQVIVTLTALLPALALGCGSDPAAPPKAAGSGGAAKVTAPQQPAKTAAATKPKADTSTPTSGSVKIEGRILEACGDIPEARFAFDSSSIEADAARSLDALARCFVSGPLKGKGMKLVGHADPRGETEYNFGLGQKRAGSVAEFLAKKGLEKDRLQSSSHGEMEASGVDEEGWARDRRVDVLLSD